MNDIKCPNWSVELVDKQCTFKFRHQRKKPNTENKKHGITNDLYDSELNHNYYSNFLPIQTVETIIEVKTNSLHI